MPEIFIKNCETHIAPQLPKEASGNISQRNRPEVISSKYS